MTNKEFLEFGYFPKELPPPFQTKMFADKLVDIETDWKAILLAKTREVKANREVFKDKFWE